MSKEICPKCDHELVYDHYLDSMKCLFCDYRQSISEPSNVYEEESKMGYSNDDDVGYGDFVERW